MAVNHVKADRIFQDDIPLRIMDIASHSTTELHDHDFYELVYIDKGFSMHTCDGMNMVLVPGDFFILSPGQVHSYLAAYNTRLYNCLFQPEIFGADFGQIKVLPGLDAIFSSDRGKGSFLKKLYLDFSERQDAVHYLDNMKWELVNKHSGWRLKVKVMLSELLILYSRVYSGRKTDFTEGGLYMQYVYKALEYIDANLAKDFFMKDVADYVGISPDYLTKHFKTILGIAPIEYIKSFRIARAAELLQSTELPVSEVASQVGFSDLSHFSRQFKQVMSVSPSSFKKLYNEKSVRKQQT